MAFAFWECPMNQKFLPFPALAVDTSSVCLSLALGNGRQRWHKSLEVGQKHSEHLLPEIFALLHAAGLTLKDLNAFVYTAGPGSFTGLRIALSVLKGLALPTHTPLIAIPTLDAIAFNAPKKTRIVAVLDARMGEIYTAFYQGKPFVKIREDTLIKKNDPLWDSLFDDPDTVIIGNAFDSDGCSNYINAHPEAANLLDLTHDFPYPRYRASDAPLHYVRHKVALTEKERQKNG